jgi:hypothetical protein
MGVSTMPSIARCKQHMPHLRLAGSTSVLQPCLPALCVLTQCVVVQLQAVVAGTGRCFVLGASMLNDVHCMLAFMACRRLV